MRIQTIAGQELSIISLITRELDGVLLDMGQSDRYRDFLLAALGRSLRFGIAMALPFIISVTLVHAIVDANTLLSYVATTFFMVILQRRFIHLVSCI